MKFDKDTETYDNNVYQLQIYQSNYFSDILTCQGSV